MRFLTEADVSQQRPRAGSHLRLTQAPELAHGHHDIVERGEFQHEKVKLKNKADMFAPRRRAIEVAAIRHQLITDPDRAVIGLVEETEQVEERALATTRRAHDRRHMTSPRLKRDAAQHMHPPLTLPEVAMQVLAPQSEASAGALHQRREAGGRSREVR